KSHETQPSRQEAAGWSLRPLCFGLELRPLHHFNQDIMTHTSRSSTETTARQLTRFIAKFEPATAKLIRSVRRELRKRLPTATELVYDNYNFFVIGYSASERPSDCIVSIAAAANGVGLA